VQENKTVIERAFELAKSSRYISVAEIIDTETMTDAQGT
jgi:hypothetical protein